MKKIDFHIHTVPTISDAHFEFSLAKLCEYVDTAELDAIAITNHDVFDLRQFNEIVNKVDCVVFPGIEINLEKGHILLISENEKLEDFQFKCHAVSEKIKVVGDSLSVDELISIFGDLNDYLLIPHYQKKPTLPRDAFDQLKNFISAGEVDSPKKFVRMAKDENEITPVIFSDVRVRESMSRFPTRQTYVDCGDLSLRSLKFCFRDKNKVALSESDGNSTFQALSDGLKLSTGLNIILGARSSGKTATLDKINEECENVKYIRQFSLVQTDDVIYERKFNERIARKKSAFADEYLNSFKVVLDDVVNINIDNNHRKIDNYLETLLKLAEEADKLDAFSKASLFNETPFEIDVDEGLNDLIKATRQLIENTEYREVIDEHVDINNLKSLARQLIVLQWDKAYEKKKRIFVNDIIREVKERLQLRTSATQIKDVDFYKILIHDKKVEQFNRMVKLLQTEKVIYEENVQQFKIVCKRRAFLGAGEIKSVSGQVVAFSEAYREYGNPYRYLVVLRENEMLTRSELYKYFACVEYEILNKDGFKVSGGERSEFRLLQEIKEAQNFDYLLIDEPESSFDNIFLKGEVNEMLKDISKTMPVVVVTHNSTVGASINADYVVYTAKETVDDEIIYRRYSGHPADKELISIDKKKINNFQITMDSLEAGEDAYFRRKSGYESIKN